MGFLSMTSEDYKSMLDDFILRNAGTVKDYFAVGGHMDKTHTGQTDKDMKMRCMEEKKDVSSFLFYEPWDGEFSDVNDIIENALLYSTKDIADWMTTRSGYDKELTIPFDNVIGYGYQNRTLEKMDTPVLRMILEKDRSDQYFGFKIQTAYPYLKDRRAKYLRQFECSRLGIDPYLDSKLTIPSEKLDNYRIEIMSKEEAVKQIKNEIIEALKADRDRQLIKEKKLAVKFCEENGIPTKDTIVKTITSKGRKKERGISIYGRIIGYVDARKEYVFPKYRNLEEVKTIMQSSELGR